MSKNLYVGNLSYNTNSDGLRDLFSQYGTVTSSQVVMDRDTGRSRGFGFVEMDAADVDAVIRATDGYAIDGRNLRVNQAEDKPAGGRGFGGRRDRY